MTTAPVLPDLEGLVSVFLQQDEAMVPIIAGRCYTVIPAEKVYPLMRVTLVDEIKGTHHPLWVTGGILQVEAWGNSAWDAIHAARTAESALAARLAGVHTRGVVTGVRFGGMRSAPDTEFTPAKQRRLFTVTVTAHPLPGS